MSEGTLNANSTLDKVLGYVDSPFKLAAILVMGVFAFAGYFVYTNQDLLIGAYKESKKIPSIAEDRVEDADHQRHYRCGVQSQPNVRDSHTVPSLRQGRQRQNQ